MSEDPLVWCQIAIDSSSVVKSEGEPTLAKIQSVSFFTKNINDSAEFYDAHVVSTFDLTGKTLMTLVAYGI